MSFILLKMRYSFIIQFFVAFLLVLPFVKANAAEDIAPDQLKALLSIDHVTEAFLNQSFMHLNEASHIDAPLNTLKALAKRYPEYHAFIADPVIHLQKMDDSRKTVLQSLQEGDFDQATFHANNMAEIYYETGLEYYPHAIKLYDLLSYIAQLQADYTNIGKNTGMQSRIENEFAYHNAVNHYKIQEYQKALAILAPLYSEQVQSDRAYRMQLNSIDKDPGGREYIGSYMQAFVGFYLARTYAALDNHENTDEIFQKSIAIMINLAGHDHPDLLYFQEVYQEYTLNQNSPL